MLMIFTLIQRTQESMLIQAVILRLILPLMRIITFINLDEKVQQLLDRSGGKDVIEARMRAARKGGEFDGLWRTVCDTL